MILPTRCSALPLFFITGTALLLSACKLGIHKDDETIDLQVDSYKEQCNEDSASLCFRIRESEMMSGRSGRDLLMTLKNTNGVTSTH